MKDQTELEAKNLRKQRAESLAVLAGDEDLVPWEEWAKQDLGRPDDLIEGQHDLKALSPFKNILTKELFQELEEMVGQVQAISNEYVGCKQSMAEVLLSNDSRAAELSRSFLIWSDRAIAYRLVRSKHRENSPLQYLDKLLVDVVKPIEAIAFKPKTANNCFMADLADYIPWKVMKLNFSELIETQVDPDNLSSRVRSTAAKPDDRYYLLELTKLYKWSQEGHLEFILKRVAAELKEDEFNLAESELRSILESMVSDIEEMRPFLLHNFKSENICLPVAPGVFMSFFFAVGHSAGLMIAAPDEKLLLSDIHRRKSRMSFDLLPDGTLSLNFLPWISTKSLSMDIKTSLRACAKIVSSLHAALFALYEKVDVASIVKRYKLKTQAEESLEPTDEEFAAIVQTIGQAESRRSKEQLAEDLEQYLPLAPADESAQEVPDQTIDLADTAKGRLQTLRLSSVLRILQQNLSCEIRQGKGSEIVIFRPGGHHFRLGHHKRNPLVHAPILKNILKQVGIGLHEWLKAAEDS
ncbi:MAG TPA: hypothetical protein PKH78_00020 [Candidatus Obscuribacter sp.]|nr:hypothetical protein [Candidatus Obscuribacter sp.]HNN61387.1 hypothetical protein [Candidatus Obscuribacter sp.]